MNGDGDALLDPRYLEGKIQFSYRVNDFKSEEVHGNTGLSDVPFAKGVQALEVLEALKDR